MEIVYEQRKSHFSVLKRQYLGCGVHLHREIEVVYKLKGKTRVYSDSREYIIDEGDLFFSFPNKVHSYETFEQEESILMIISPEIIPDFIPILLKKAPKTPILRKAQLPNDIRNIITNAYKAKISEEQFSETICKGYLTVLFGKIMPLFDFEDSQNTNTDMLSSILAYCTQNYTESISLSTMAEALHASKYYISRLFSEKIKISFNDYINTLRINDAKEKLTQTELSITEIGNAVGYNTIRSFNRAFLSQTGIQPREFRNLNKRK